jgi:phosphoglycerate dehydrogenase-like enzyme
LLFPEEILQQLSAVSDVDWVPVNQAYDHEQLKADIQQYDVCLTSWGSPKLTAEVLHRADKLAFVGHAAGKCLPHIGTYSAYWKSQLGAMVVEDLVRFASGKPLLRRVTGERFERMTST